ncbi:hypothetical protein [Vogesella mureinivorans]
MILYRSGVISQASYLSLLKGQIDRYLQNPGRLMEWIKSIFGI